ncbi:hypothetical protein [Pseudomonas mohnii]
MYNIYPQDNTTFFSDALRRTPKKTEKTEKKTSAMRWFFIGDARLPHLQIGTNPAKVMVREESDWVSDISAGQFGVVANSHPFVTLKPLLNW